MSTQRWRRTCRKRARLASRHDFPLTQPMRNCAHHTGDQACFIACSPWQPGQPAGRLHHRPNQTIPSNPDRPRSTAQANADWENLGVSPNGNILNELDKLSIKPQGSVVTFRDRKTIFNVKKKTSCPPHGTRLPSTAG
jgi:hypothetical protein